MRRNQVAQVKFHESATNPFIFQRLPPPPGGLHRQIHLLTDVLNVVFHGGNAFIEGEKAALRPKRMMMIVVVEHESFQLLFHADPDDNSFLHRILLFFHWTQTRAE